MRRVVVVIGLLAVLAGSGCGGVGSTPTAGAGQVKGVLHSAAETRHDGSVFAGLAVTPDGTVFLGAADGDFMHPENIRILTLRRGQQPRILLAEKHLALPGVDRIEPRAMAVAPGNELLLVGYGDDAVKIVGVGSKGKKRIVSILPGRTYRSYGLEITAIAADPRDGTIYLAERCRIHRAAPGTEFALFAGDRIGQSEGQCRARAEGEPPLLRSFLHIGGLAVDPRSGALYVSDSARVFRIDAAGVTAVAGRPGSDDHGLPGFSGDDGPALEARLDQPGALAFDGATGDLYICDLKNQRIRKIDSAGTITTAVGDGNFRRPYEGRATDVAVDGIQVAIDGQRRLWATAYADVSADEIWSERLITTTLSSKGHPGNDR